MILNIITYYYNIQFTMKLLMMMMIMILMMMMMMMMIMMMMVMATTMSQCLRESWVVSTLC